LKKGLHCTNRAINQLFFFPLILLKTTFRRHLLPPPLKKQAANRLNAFIFFELKNSNRRPLTKTSKGDTVNVYVLCRLSKKELKSWSSYLHWANSQNNTNLFLHKFLIVVQDYAAGSLADLGTQVKLLK
jgi:hypothetical protein